MSLGLSIDYLTGAVKVTKNHLNSDDLILRERRTVRQMFFQPYESKEEYIYCARHTFLPMAQIIWAILDPIVTVAVPAIVSSVLILFGALWGINKLCGNEDGAAFFFNAAEYIFKDFCQFLIDLVVCPLSAIIMSTRGISTGLHAVGILGGDRDEVIEEAPSLAVS
ncbi:hypothetical protein OQJ13_08480 [Legionella sp. PATHC035]|uniref:hypothetical protein n=1 Tax=Legionella sp. PATHC035 TaxID=2992040 RepID=UPI002243CCB2|nr:hypothetical protein [Legionella sp. PATHC035]MCW8409004.1 hypothetical protein [Legionella sp. PATHC035]